MLLVLALLSLCFGAAHPEPWPETWSSSWNFVNTSNRVLLNFGTYYYDFLGHHQLMRVDNRLCEPQRKSPCNVFFNMSNCYSFQPETGDCCLLFNNVGATPPNWLASATFTKITEYYGEKTYQWKYIDSDGASHNYWQNYNGRIRWPVAFGDSNQVQEWLGITPHVERHRFELPSPKCQTPCKSIMDDETLLGMQDYVMSLPYVRKY